MAVRLLRTLPPTLPLSQTHLLNSPLSPSISLPALSVHIYDDEQIKNANKFQFSNSELTRGGNMTVTITVTTSRAGSI